MLDSPLRIGICWGSFRRAAKRNNRRLERHHLHEWTSQPMLFDGVDQVACNRVIGGASESVTSADRRSAQVLGIPKIPRNTFGNLKWNVCGSQFKLLKSGRSMRDRDSACEKEAYLTIHFGLQVTWPCVKSNEVPIQFTHSFYFQTEWTFRWPNSVPTVNKKSSSVSRTQLVDWRDRLMGKYYDSIWCYLKSYQTGLPVVGWQVWLLLDQLLACSHCWSQANTAWETWFLSLRPSQFFFHFSSWEFSGPHSTFSKLPLLAMSFKKQQTTGDVPQPRTQCGMCCVGNKIYLFGGTTMVDSFNDMFVLDTGGMNFSEMWR